MAIVNGERSKNRDSNCVKESGKVSRWRGVLTGGEFMTLKTIRVIAVGIMFASVAYCDWVGRYSSYPYQMDAGDPVPGLFYSKVCEPGVSGEDRATYVTIGTVYPKRVGVPPSYKGALVIPETIDGLPVRKIMDSAFVACSQLTSITIPATVREVGDLAFSWCTALTNVAFLGGVEMVGTAAFSNCLSLASVTFPPTLRRLGFNCFVLCDSLQTITFLGNAPELDGPPADITYSYLGEKHLAGALVPTRAKIVIREGTVGWKGPYLKGVPEKWPVQYGWMTAHEVVPMPAASGGLVFGIARQP